MCGTAKGPRKISFAHRTRGTHGKRFGFPGSVCSVCSVGKTWIDQTIFFVDFEGSRSSGVIEYGVVGLLRGEIFETKTRLCRATGAVRREDTAVHGLSGEMLCGQSAFADEWEYFADLRERGPLAAHYAGVENALLKSVWPYPRSS